MGSTRVNPAADALPRVDSGGALWVTFGFHDRIALCHVWERTHAPDLS